MREGPFIVVCIKRIGLPYLVTVPLIGICLVVLGQILLSLNGVGGSNALLRHWYIPVFVAGFVWVECVLCWAHDRYEKILRDLPDVFDIPERDYTLLVDSHLKSVYGELHHIYFVAPILAFSVFYVVATRQQVFWVPQYVLSEVLAPPSVFGYFLFIVCLCGIVGFYGVSEIWLHIAFVRRVSRIPLNIKIFKVRRTTQLKELGQFSGVSSITWFVGLALVTPMFFSVVNPITVSIFIFALVVGVSMLAIPQFSLHSAVVSAKSKVMEELTRSMLSVREDDLPKILSINTLFRHAEGINEWPFSLGSLAQQFVGLAIPITTFILQSLLRPG